MGGSLPASPQAEAGRKACALGLKGDASEGYQSVNERVYCLAGLDEGLVLEPLERDMCCSRPLASTRSPLIISRYTRRASRPLDGTHS
jgi:hypothetical protein